MKESLEKQAPMLNPDTRATKEKEYQTKLREFQRWGEGYSKMKSIRNGWRWSETSPLGFQKVIQKLGADDGYTLILEKNENIVLYVSKTIDITDRVIKAYDAQKK